MTELAVTRTIEIRTPRDKVWAALTDPALVSQWFGQVVETGWESLSKTQAEIERDMAGNSDGWVGELDEFKAYLEKQDSV